MARETLIVWQKIKVVGLGWSNTANDSVQWAALHGDCTHQVLGVSSSHRTTLTWNLHFSKVGYPGQPVANPEELALHSMIKDVYDQTGFLTKDRYWHAFMLQETQD